MAKVTLKVKGMTCGHCERTVREVLEGASGVRSAEVDLAGGKATVEYDEGRASPQELVGLVVEEGYQAEAS